MGEKYPKDLENKRDAKLFLGGFAERARRGSYSKETKNMGLTLLGVIILTQGGKKRELVKLLKTK